MPIQTQTLIFGNRKAINPNLAKAIKDKEYFAIELRKAQEEHWGVRDLRLMLDVAKLQIQEDEVEIARLTEILREAAKDNKEPPKKHTIDYNRELSGSDSSLSSRDKSSSWRRQKRASNK